jgi:hypothetical protein
MFFKVKIFLRYWKHTGQEKPPRRGKTSRPPHPQPTHSSPTSRDMEKQGGLLCHQAPAPNLLGRPTVEQISGTWFFYSYPREKLT